MTMNNKRYHKLIIKEIFGDIETSDKHLLEEWLAKSAEQTLTELTVTVGRVLMVTVETAGLDAHPPGAM